MTFLKHTLLLLCLLTLAACEVDTPSRRSSIAKTPTPTPIKDNPEALSYAELSKKQDKTWEEWDQLFYSAPMEDYNDPEQWDDFRVEVVFFDRSVKDERHYYVLSMKMDGTDVRKAAGPELLYKDDDKLGKRMYIDGVLRSPNNKYLVARFTYGLGGFTAFIDLEKQTNKKIGFDSFPAMFAWSQDSSYVYFNDSDGTWKYTVAEDKVEKHEKGIPGRTLVLFNGDLLSTYGQYYDISDPLGKRIVKRHWHTRFIDNTMFDFSTNRRYVGVGHSDHKFIYDLEDNREPVKPIFTTPKVYNRTFSIMDDGIFFYDSDKGLMFQKFDEKTPRIVPNTKKIPNQYMDIINHQLSNSSRPKYPYLQLKNQGKTHERQAK